MKSTAHWSGAAILLLATASGPALAWQGGTDPDTLRLFRDEQFKGKNQVIHPLTSERAHQLVALHKHLRNKMSSMEWNLPRGVVVIFYQYTNGTGRQFVVWGSGRRGDLKDADFDNKAAACAWFYVDGWADAPSHIRGGFAERPVMASISKKRRAEESMELHKDKAMRGTKDKNLIEIKSLTDVEEGVLKPIREKLNNKLSSLRWNFPPGIVVIFYDNADGTGRRLPLFGEGEMPDVRAMNNRISAWAWYDAAADGASYGGK